MHLSSATPLLLSTAFLCVSSVSLCLCGSSLRNPVNPAWSCSSCLNLSLPDANTAAARVLPHQSPLVAIGGEVVRQQLPGTKSEGPGIFKQIPDVLSCNIGALL